ncbi:MAG: hypothetical protein HOD63_11965 [Bacteroidetes bacterium]|nr:hypothetical protein [Bacteroidota bacterium]MBT3934773.1 hypothetical protein [Bacteroidota bacterium]MBT4339298.1 hypothetical protein [Bacteroidota bacterium]MBT4730167.1 hypothetical protein [Bacteroidota bacterium]MBT4970065.1 hypothetical protein [Bacteroidota bacterium]
MKYLSLIILMFVLISCGEKDNFPAKVSKHNRLVFDQAFKTGDVNTAISSAQELLVYDTGNYDLMDTLASLYLNKENYNAAFNFSKKMLSLKTDDPKGIEIYAKSAANLNLSQEAINGYSKLYELDNKTAYLYEIAVQNYNIGNMANGETIIESIINTPASKQEMYRVRIAVNTFQNVPVISMCYYFLGTLNELQGQTKDAQSYFMEALENAPEFILAKNKIARYK